VGLKALVFEGRVTRAGPDPRADQIAIRTEREIAELVALGLTNRHIAERS